MTLHEQQTYWNDNNSEPTSSPCLSLLSFHAPINIQNPHMHWRWKACLLKKILQISATQHIPGGLVVRIWHSHPSGPGSNKLKLLHFFSGDKKRQEWQFFPSSFSNSPIYLFFWIPFLTKALQFFKSSTPLLFTFEWLTPYSVLKQITSCKSLFCKMLRKVIIRRYSKIKPNNPLQVKVNLLHNLKERK